MNNARMVFKYAGIGATMLGGIKGAGAKVGEMYNKGMSSGIVDKANTAIDNGAKKIGMTKGLGTKNQKAIAAGGLLAGGVGAAALLSGNKKPSNNTL